ncbi:RdRP-domain-containing protein [Hymenopellis radicata]|nr:RdRP-domain-containing protein [Hymenopellis radicata]
MAFTTTDPTTTDVENLHTIDDIKRVDGDTGIEWNFTDGVGTMSPEFARRVTAGRRSTATLYRDVYPRAIQIRFEGSKGVLSVDYTLTGHTVCLRPSMVKFTGTPSTRIEIAQVFNKPGNFYLNRPLIMILEGLGVPYQVFKKYQENAIEKIDLATSSVDSAALFLNDLGLGTAYRVSGTLIRLHRLGVPLPRDSFYSRAMLYARNDALRDIKHKSRIPIPDTYNLVGVADVHGFLKEGEVSVCLELVPGGPRRYLSGYVLISRSPCIHPGDVQIAKAIGHPRTGSCFAKEPLANTLVFSTKGQRPLCSYLGGGDLDGDEYAVISLDQHPGFRHIRRESPGRYDPAVLKRLPRECTQDDIAQFVVDFINTDNLGVLSITWRILADAREDGIFDKDCMLLADLHSRAVDFPKSGTAVAIREIPRRPSLLPDWHAPETMSYLDPDVYYASQRAIGKLFRAVDLPAVKIESSAARQERRRAEADETADPFEDEDEVVTEALSTAFSRFTSYVSQHLPINTPLTPTPDRIDSLRSTFLYYRSQLQNTCSLHSILPGRGAMLTEEEVFIGTIVANASQPAKRLDHISKVREETTLLVNHVREELMSVDGESVRDLEHRLRLSYWAWRRCLQSDVFGANSFGWIAMEVCFRLIDEIDETMEQMFEGLQI